MGKLIDEVLDKSVIEGNPYENNIYSLQDLKPANVLADTNGNAQVIDGDFDLKRGTGTT